MHLVFQASISSSLVQTFRCEWAGCTYCPINQLMAIDVWTIIRDCVPFERWNDTRLFEGKFYLVMLIIHWYDKHKYINMNSNWIEWKNCPVQGRSIQFNYSRLQTSVSARVPNVSFLNMHQNIRFCSVRNASMIDRFKTIHLETTNLSLEIISESSASARWRRINAVFSSHRKMKSRHCDGRHCSKLDDRISS